MSDSGILDRAGRSRLPFDIGFDLKAVHESGIGPKPTSVASAMVSAF
jgi:hypothetical protein